MIPTKNLEDNFHAGADSSIPRSRTGSSRSGAAMVGSGTASRPTKRHSMTTKDYKFPNRAGLKQYLDIVSSRVKGELSKCFHLITATTVQIFASMKHLLPAIESG